MAVVIFSIGSNIGERQQTITLALDAIAAKIGELKRISSLYETEPVGFESNELFLNICAEVETELSPIEILFLTQNIEEQYGRTRKDGNGYSSRTIDIDILFYDTQILQTNQLQIPHPRYQERRFVLEPLLEILPEFTDPIHGESIQKLVQKCSDTTKIIRLKHVKLV
jgi:2-amino-4-hydroxy-6-hydroxymethyldihydropteridine diphosphokinase